MVFVLKKTNSVKKIFKFIYFERRGGQRERERERIPSRLQAVSAEPDEDVGLKFVNREVMA